MNSGRGQRVRHGKMFWIVDITYRGYCISLSLLMALVRLVLIIRFIILAVEKCSIHLGAVGRELLHEFDFHSGQKRADVVPFARLYQIHISSGMENRDRALGLDLHGCPGAWRSAVSMIRTLGCDLNWAWQGCHPRRMRANQAPGEGSDSMTDPESINCHFSNLPLMSYLAMQVIQRTGQESLRGPVTDCAKTAGKVSDPASEIVPKYGPRKEILGADMEAETDLRFGLTAEAAMTDPELADWIVEIK